MIGKKNMNNLEPQPDSLSSAKNENCSQSAEVLKGATERAFIRSTHRLLFTIVNLAFIALGCSEDPWISEVDESASNSQKIINGDLASGDWGIAWVRTPTTDGRTGHCTATVLGDSWLLTAKHCFEKDDNANNIHIHVANTPQLVRVTLPSSRTTEAFGDRIELMPGDQTRDVALLHVSTPFRQNAQGTPYINPLYFGSLQSLSGRNVTCYGYGQNTFTGWNPDVPDAHPLRVARVPVGDIAPIGFGVKPNSSGQVPWGGDSGGPCFVWVDGSLSWQLAGVLAHCQDAAGTQTVLGCGTMGAPMFRDWVWATIGASVGVYSEPDYQGSIQALLPGTYNMNQLLVGNDAISSIRVPSPWSLGLYEHGNFWGAEQWFDGGAWSSLTEFGFDNLASSAQVQGGVTIYEHFFEGSQQRLGPGRYAMADLSIGNDTLSSLRVPAGWQVTLFEHEFTGRSRTFGEGDFAWVGDDFNDQTSSIIVEEPVSVCADADLGGACSRLWPGSQGNAAWYSTTRMGIADNSISSIHVPTGFVVELYDGDRLTGTSWSFTASMGTLGDADNKASSIRIYRQ